MWACIYIYIHVGTYICIYLCACLCLASSHFVFLAGLFVFALFPSRPSLSFCGRREGRLLRALMPVAFRLRCRDALFCVALPWHALSTLCVWVRGCLLALCLLHVISLFLFVFFLGGMGGFGFGKESCFSCGEATGGRADVPCACAHLHGCPLSFLRVALFFFIAFFFFGSILCLHESTSARVSAVHGNAPADLHVGEGEWCYVCLLTVA